MVEAEGRSAAVRAFLGRVAEACQDAVVQYIDDVEPPRRFQSYVLLALAAIEQASRAGSLEPADLRFMAGAASDAAAVCRTQEPEEGIAAVAACFEEAARSCRSLLEDAAAFSPWQRFLFEDVDLDVLRDVDVWRVRVQAAETSDRLLDIAIEQARPDLTPHRIGQLTVQILAWHAFDATRG